MSALSKLLERLKAKAEAKQATEADAYRALVRRAAEGREIDPDKLLSELTRLGRDPEEFRRDAELLARRLDWRQLADGLAGHQKELAGLEAKLLGQAAHFDAEAERVRAERFAAMRPTEVAIDDVKGKIRAADDAARKLAETAPAEVGERLRAKEAEIGELNGKRAFVVERLDRLRKQVPVAELNKSWADAKRADLDEPASRRVQQEILDREREKTDRTCAGTHEAIAELERQLAEDFPAELRRLQAERDAIAAEADRV
jgi:hypothetical protein